MPDASRTSLRSLLKPLSNTSTIVTSLLSPLSVLADMAQCGAHTYTHASAALPITVLSVFNVILSVLVNALFAWRLYPLGESDRRSLPLLTASWTVKVGMQVGSAVVSVRQAGDREYAEGLFCTLVSLVIAVLVLICQWVHHVHVEPQTLHSQILIRHFYFQLLVFVLWLSLSSITFGNLEGWDYLDSLYFTVVYTLTVGFGDRYPTMTSGKVLLFFFAIIGIAQIGTLVSLMLKFFQSGTSERRDQFRRFLEQDRTEFPTDLNSEIRQLEKLERTLKRDGLSLQSFIATCSFLSFWVLGACLFSTTEGMDFGDALYLCYITFLTIGFGDRVIETAAGKVIFIFYALVSVPIMTGFVFEVYTQVFRALSEAALDDVEDDPDEAHDAQVETSHAKLVEGHRDLSRGDEKGQLASALVQFEGIARDILLSTLTGPERNLLLADRNVRMRIDGVSEEAIKDESVDIARDVRRYRDSYAKLVALLGPTAADPSSRLVDI